MNQCVTPGRRSRARTVSVAKGTTGTGAPRGARAQLATATANGSRWMTLEIIRGRNARIAAGTMAKRREEALSVAQFATSAFRRTRTRGACSVGEAAGGYDVVRAAAARTLELDPNNRYARSLRNG